MTAYQKYISELDNIDNFIHQERYKREQQINEFQSIKQFIISYQNLLSNFKGIVCELTAMRHYDKHALQNYFSDLNQLNHQCVEYQTWQIKTPSLKQKRDYILNYCYQEMPLAEIKKCIIDLEKIYDKQQKINRKYEDFIEESCEHHKSKVNSIAIYQNYQTELEKIDNIVHQEKTKRKQQINEFQGIKQLIIKHQNIISDFKEIVRELTAMNQYDSHALQNQFNDLNQLKQQAIEHRWFIETPRLKQKLDDILDYCYQEMPLAEIKHRIINLQQFYSDECQERANREAEYRLQQQDEKLRIKKQEDEYKRQQQEAEARRKQQEEEEAEARRKQQEEEEAEARRKQQEEEEAEARRKQQEEEAEARRKQQEEEKRHKREYEIFKTKAKVYNGFYVNESLVFDSYYKLIWLRHPLGSFSFDEAVKETDKFNQSGKNFGYQDWRLPTVEDFSSLKNSQYLKNRYESYENIKKVIHIPLVLYLIIAVISGLVHDSFSEIFWNIAICTFIMIFVPKILLSISYNTFNKGKYWSIDTLNYDKKLGMIAEIGIYGGIDNKHTVSESEYQYVILVRDFNCSWSEIDNVLYNSS